MAGEVQQVACPHCSKPIRSDALACKWCNGLILQPATERKPEPPPTPSVTLAFILAAVVAVVVLLYRLGQEGMYSSGPGYAVSGAGISLIVWWVIWWVIIASLRGVTHRLQRR